MGKVLQRAGGGKVTVEGLEPEVLKKGSTVTVKQGSKAVRQVAGSYGTVRRMVLGSGTSFNVSALFPDTYHTFTAENFGIISISASGSMKMDNGNSESWSASLFSISYNAETGVVTVGSTSASGSGWGYSWSSRGTPRVCCYYVE